MNIDDEDLERSFQQFQVRIDQDHRAVLVA